ncbi:MAG: tRNA-binding protein [Pseudomonadota bacterium]
MSTTPVAEEATFDDFMKIDLRVGEVIEAEPFPEARKPAIKLKIDFGEPLGVKKSSAQITANYARDNLVGKQVICIVNFPPRQIGPFLSEVLTLGVPDDAGEVVLLTPDFPAALGGRVY